MAAAPRHAVAVLGAAVATAHRVMVTLPDAPLETGWEWIVSGS
jgi:hypothetical protein